MAPCPSGQTTMTSPILRLAVRQALATDAFYGYKDEGILDRALDWAAW